MFYNEKVKTMKKEKCHGKTEMAPTFRGEQSQHCEMAVLPKVACRHSKSEAILHYVRKY